MLCVTVGGKLYNAYFYSQAGKGLHTSFLSEIQTYFNDTELAIQIKYALLIFDIKAKIQHVKWKKKQQLKYVY